MVNFQCILLILRFAAAKKVVSKIRDGTAIEKKQQELEKRLENVKGALGAPSKKTPKKGIKSCNCACLLHLINTAFIRLLFERSRSTQELLHYFKKKLIDKRN